MNDANPPSLAYLGECRLYVVHNKKGVQVFMALHPDERDALCLQVTHGEIVELWQRPSLCSGGIVNLDEFQRAAYKAYPSRPAVRDLDE